MRFLFTTDIHASDEHLFSMLKTAEKKDVDAVVVGGDIVPHYLPEFEDHSILEAQSLYLERTFVPAMERFKLRSRAKIYLDMGNDDFIFGRKILENRKGELFELLHMEVHRFSENVDIAGYMSVPPTPYHRKDWEKPDCATQPFAHGNLIALTGTVSKNGFPEKTVLGLNSPDTMERDLTVLEKKIARPFIFVSHAPPYDTRLDIMYDGLHVGSLAVRRFIEKWAGKRKLIGSFHGHIHESPRLSGSVKAVFHGAKCFNPGQGNGPGSIFQYVLMDLSGEKLGRCRKFFF